MDAGAVGDGEFARRVRVVFRLDPGGDHEDLDELEERVALVEGFRLIALDLVERLFEASAGSFELDVNHGEPVDENRDVVPVALLPFGAELAHDLEAVGVNFVFVEEVEIADGTVFATEVDERATVLQEARFILDPLLRVGEIFFEEALPFVVGEFEVVETFELASEILDELLLGVEIGEFVALVEEYAKKGVFERPFGHRGVVDAFVLRLVAGRDGILGRLDDYLMLQHLSSSFS